MCDQSQRRYAYFRHEDCEAFPCHKGIDVEEFNCLFCYCPLYGLGEDCGGGFTYTEKGVKNCANCIVPHKRENYDAIVARFPELAKLAAKKFDA